MKKLWTIGHSTRSEEEFINALRAFGIKLVADIRSSPSSMRYPYFNKQRLEISLPLAGVRYHHLPSLGGRREPIPGSVNNGLRSRSFRGFADHMSTFEFRQGIENLIYLSEDFTTAIMCSEKDWGTCHRFLISDYMDVRGYNVTHIIDEQKSEKHILSRGISVIEGKIFYS